MSARFSALLKKFGGKSPQKANKESPAQAKVVPKSTGKITDFIVERKPSGRLEIVDTVVVKKGRSTSFSKKLQRTYQVDSQKYALDGVQPVLIHDKDIFEPLDSGKGEVGFETMAPHYSERADNIVRLSFVSQAVGSLRGMVSDGLNWKTAIIFAIVGYFVGNSIPLHQFGV